MDKQKDIDFSIKFNERIVTTLTDGLVLLFGLHGESTVQTLSGQSLLGPSSMYIIPPSVFYSMDCPTDAGLLQLWISPAILGTAGWNAGSAARCQLISGPLNNNLHLALRQKYAALFHLSVQSRMPEDVSEAAAEMAAFILRNFPAPSKQNVSADGSGLLLLGKILLFIQEHWKEPLSLTDISEKEFLSGSYLARLFRKYLNQTFTEYIVSIRLERARQSLRDTRYSVTEIAYDCGFKSTNSFIHYFRQYYGTTPGQYRKSCLAPCQPDSSSGDISDWMSELLQYTEDASAPKEGKAAAIPCELANVDAAQPGTPMRRPWQRLVNIGYARDGLVGEVQAQLRRAKEEIGFTDIRFHGIFDDDMHIYQLQADGSPWYNFTYVDLLLDFILSIGLTPFIELSFVPAKLAKNPYRLFDRCSIAGMYSSRIRWEALVQATVAHWIVRYGLDAVVRWHFTCFSFNYVILEELQITYEEYLEMYQATYAVLKELDPRLRLGGPGCFSHVLLAEDGGVRFLRDAVSRGCPPDFLTAQCYPHENTVQDSDFLYFTANQQSTPSVLSEDEDFTAHFLQAFRELAERCGLRDREIILEEWSSTLWQRDLSGDTCYRSAWIVKNSLQCCNDAHMLGYWQLTDLMDEWLVPGGIFHGGYGLFTASGIPKAAYRGLQFLTRTGTEKIASGKSWFVSRSGTTMQIFLYHYCHYDALYRYRYQKLKNPHDAYSVFQDTGDLHISLTLSGLQPGSYRCERRIISRHTGSAFDKWLEIGAHEAMKPDDLRYLADTSQPAYEISQRNTDGTLLIEGDLHPHEVQLIVLQKLDR